MNYKGSVSKNIPPRWESESCGGEVEKKKKESDKFLQWKPSEHWLFSHLTFLSKKVQRFEITREQKQSVEGIALGSWNHPHGAQIWVFGSKIFLRFLLLLVSWHETLRRSLPRFFWKTRSKVAHSVHKGLSLSPTWLGGVPSTRRTSQYPLFTLWGSWPLCARGFLDVKDVAPDCLVSLEGPLVRANPQHHHVGFLDFFRLLQMNKDKENRSHLLSSPPYRARTGRSDQLKKFKVPVKSVLSEILIKFL